MSAISELETSLQAYWQMPHHRDSALQSCLLAVQAWQKHRMQTTHEILFAEENHEKLSHYFLNRLYGSTDFDTLARQLERMLPRAKKIEKIMPNTAIATGNLGINLAILAVQLDEEVATYLVENSLAVTEKTMLQAYNACDQKADRERQMQSLSELCYRLDKYVRSYLLKKAFDLSKNAAYNNDLHALYDFLVEGFEAMQPVKSMKKFVEPFCERELKLIENVHNGVENPLQLD